MQLSHRTLDFPCSPTVAVSERARRMQADGSDVVALAAGEPELAVAQHIVEAARQAVEKARSPYPALSGSLPLRKQIAERLSAHTGIAHSADGVVVTNGAKQAIYNACLALVNPGDRVVVPVPSWATFMDAVRLAGGTPLAVATRLEERFMLIPEALKEVLDGAVGVILNSPSNPTGAACSEADWAGLAAVLRTSDAFILVDEIYAELVFEGERAPSLLKVAPDLAPRTVVISGVSKAYAMAGYRVGWAVTTPAVAEAIANFQSLTTSGTSLISQEAALAALTGPQDGVVIAARHYKARVKWAMEQFSQVPGCRWLSPDGTFYLFVSVPGDDLAISLELLDNAGVAVVPGRAFGCAGFVRVSLAGEEGRVRLGVERMVECLKKWKGN